MEGEGILGLLLVFFLTDFRNLIGFPLYILENKEGNFRRDVEGLANFNRFK